MMLLTSRGTPFSVSPEDVEQVRQYRWHTTHYGYIATNMKVDDGYKHVRLHRWLLGVTDERVLVDHRDGDTANNTRSNLRVCTRRQNAANQKPRGATSAFKGVSRSHPHRPRAWRANIRGKLIGHFRTEEEAAVAYDIAARATYGEFARLNFGGVFA